MPYIELALLKSALGVTDTARDLLLEQAIAAAEGSIHERTGRTFGQSVEPSTRVFKTYGRTLRTYQRNYHGERLLVDDIASIDGLTVDVSNSDDDSWTPVHETRWEAGPDNAITLGRPVTSLDLLYSWWSLYRRVKVTAVWGWPKVPDSIVQATLIQAGRLYRRKDSPEGVAGSAEWGLVRLPHLDPDVRALVDPFRLTSFG